jgi:hypothetical protein
MRLIGETGIERDIRNLTTASELRAAVLNAAIDQISVRRHPIALLECANQMGCGQFRGLANVVEFQRLCAVLSNEFSRPCELAAGVMSWRTRRIQRLL